MKSGRIIAAVAAMAVMLNSAVMTNTNNAPQKLTISAAAFDTGFRIRSVWMY